MEVRKVINKIRENTGFYRRFSDRPDYAQRVASSPA